MTAIAGATIDIRNLRRRIYVRPLLRIFTYFPLRQILVISTAATATIAPARSDPNLGPWRKHQHRIGAQCSRNSWVTFATHVLISRQSIAEVSRHSPINFDQ